MSLPGEYQKTTTYFEDALEFLKNHQWIYNYPNTHILVNKVFDQIPEEWKIHLTNLTSEDRNDMSTGKLKEYAPQSLKYFMNEVNRLKPKFEKVTQECDHKFPKNSGLNLKKTHEILSFAPFIHEICQQNGITNIIDVGSGLGYLPRLLQEKYSYSILGIESNSKYITAAKSYQTTNSNAESYIRYAEHFITEESAEFIKSLATENGIESACITGLHACADLSVTMLKLYLQLDFAKALIIMPCCYHRIEKVKSELNGEETFKNFPASRSLKLKFSEMEAQNFLRTPFLRLACQSAGDAQVGLSEAERKQQANNWLFRAILQEVVEEENCRVTRLKRKSGRTFRRSPGDGSGSTTFEDHLRNIGRTHALICTRDSGGDVNNINDPKFLNRMREKWTRHNDGGEEHTTSSYLMESLARFQALIQPVCENVILLDRVQFLMENNTAENGDGRSGTLEKVKCCWVEKVVDERLSPRCYALVAIKSQTSPDT